MSGWLQHPGQFGGNEEVCSIDLVHPNSSIWSGLEFFIPLNLNTHEARECSLAGAIWTL